MVSKGLGCLIVKGKKKVNRTTPRGYESEEPMHHPSSDSMNNRVKECDDETLLLEEGLIRDSERRHHICV
ncbi:hypothetical protein Y1Q_0003904 [Alligator mississippiensis]|uniref:Uncharacterized protein n=1 Tax=Alligator mississippiensis TaxID=8496 RepID=A0A151MNQ5_ALLMI|nr:hypothetical protein Y1Q_0003904 [Alligator mississippiensis]